MKATILVGDCRIRLPELPDCSVDSIVTDPPYELGFMGKAWDSSGVAYDPATWTQCLRMLKPGGHLLSFGGSRTYHRMTCAIEDAGFEIRDQIQWIYGSGFPKSLNLGDGWGTALKPAHEPICLARKPFKGTVGENVQRYGTGALNIDGCRIDPTGERLGGGGESRATFEGKEGWTRPWMSDPTHAASHAAKVSRNVEKATELGRWPANVIHDGSDEVVSNFPEEAGAVAPVTVRNVDKFRNTYSAYGGNDKDTPFPFHGDMGSAARFFYCAKTSREERNAGCYDIEAKPLLWSSGEKNPGSFQAEGTNRSAENNHPTVKPVDLMRYLCRMVTPKGGTVLDPFSGSGSTGMAALEEGFDCILIELSPAYAAISQKRIGTVAPMFNAVEKENRCY